MWIATKYGFFSAVQKPAGKISIRARCRTDLESLAKFASIKEPVVESPEGDYCCRIITSPQEWQRITAKLAADVDYDNFKDMIEQSPNQSEKLRYYHAIWEVMFRYQLNQRS